MDRPHLIRRLRIAASVFFAVVAVALCVLWVRSYWRADSMSIPTYHSTATLSSAMQGRLRFDNCDAPSDYDNYWHRKTMSLQIRQEFRKPPRIWGYFSNHNTRTLYFPHWVPVAASSVLIAAYWIPWSKSFSIRTLLIATTLVAVVLGLGVWATG